MWTSETWARAAPWQRALAIFFVLLAASEPTAQNATLTPQQIDSLRGRYGDAAVTRISEWDTISARTANLSESGKLELVNAFFNRLRFVQDDVHWGRADYWATPVEFLGTGAGDCEDYSIAKYFTLKQIGVPVEKLRITYVKALGRPVPAHMVLAYYDTPGADPLILDNLIEEIRPGSERTDLVPVYSFNGEGLWLAVAKSRGRKVRGAVQLAAWNNLLNRMERDQALDAGQSTSR